MNKSPWTGIAGSTSIAGHCFIPNRINCDKLWSENSCGSDGDGGADVSAVSEFCLKMLNLSYHFVTREQPGLTAS